jgi:hypothetical protein
MTNPGCKHQSWKGTRHCAEMACSNYVEKCPEHSITRSEDGLCNFQAVETVEYTKE